jgi:sialic acid synthase SpsE/UDP-galactopyranose mutase
MDTQHFDLVVIGGGPAGCAIAFYAAVKNLKTLLIEKSAALGGLARSWEWEGFIVDTGPHIFHSPDPIITRDWKENFGHLLHIEQYYASNYISSTKEYIPYPLSRKSLGKINYRNINKKADSLASFLTNACPNHASKTFREYLISLVGPELEEAFFRIYPEKLWGISTNDMLADWAPRRIRITEEDEAFFEDQFCSVSRQGTGAIFEDIKAKSVGKGSAFLCSTEVLRLVVSGRKVSKVVTAENEIEVTDNCKVVSTVPLNICAKWFGIESSLRYRGVLSTYVSSKTPFNVWPRKYSWVYYQDRSLAFHRITEPTRMCPELNTFRDSSRSYIIAESSFDVDCVNYNERNVEELYLDTLGGLRDLGFLYDESEQKTAINVEPFVYPVQDHAYREQYKFIIQEIGRYSNLELVGAAADFAYSDMQVVFRKARDFVNDYVNDRSAKLELTEFPLSRQYFNSLINFNDTKPSTEVAFIAEIGINHNGEKSILRELIDKCAAADCHFIKFQYYKTESRITEWTRELNYNEKAQETEVNIRDQLSQSQLSLEEILEACRHVKSLGKEPMCSAFSLEGFEELINSQLIRHLKVASMDANNIYIHRYLSKLDRRFHIYISTGMCSLDEVKRIVAIYDGSECNVTVMQCTSSYPLPLEAVNLSVLDSYRQELPANINLGYSDHTSSNIATLASIHYGISCIEKHVTLDRSMRGPDHYQSITTDELGTLISDIKTQLLVRGCSIKTVQPCEYEAWRTQKKSLYTNARINTGDTLEEDMLTVKSPPLGSDPLSLDNIVGKVLDHSIERGVPFV